MTPPPLSTTSAPGRNKPPGAAAADMVETREAAVIDVGSNSVRLVVYRIDGRAMTPTLNEKVMAGLGRGLNRTGRLSHEGAAAAQRALRRFAAIIADLGVRDVYAVATAAVREAEDGRAFADRVARETGFRLRILSGADEARLSALGVLAGEPEARGVVGDLGGSSLELIEIGDGLVGAGETFALGHLSLAGPDGFQYERVAAAADAAFAKLDAIDHHAGALYAVGGVWRALGRIHMSLTDHPLRVLHHHEISRADVFKVAETVRRQSRRSLEKLEEAAAKRADSLPYGAVVLERLMLRGGFDRVVLSALGVREGVLLEQMDAAALAAHPLIAAAEAFAGPHARARAFGQALARWIAPAFLDEAPLFSPTRDPVLRAAAARLADLGGALHPDQRGEIMYDLVLRAPLAAISHAERAFLAACVHHRYTKAPPRDSAAYRRLLDDAARSAAQAVGASLRLGADVSARSEALLAHFRLTRDEAGLALRVARKEADLISDQAARRLDTLGAALGVATRIELE
ncbi:MAG: Ppx/GppA family phosphatase [Hyphomonadaceae bacterium]